MNIKNLFFASSFVLTAVMLNAALLPLQASAQSNALDLRPSQNTSTNSNQSMHSAQQGYQLLQDRKQHEEMRDKRHDGRYQTSPNSSVGGTLNPPSVNYLQTFD